MWSSLEDPPWIRLEDPSTVGVARRAVTSLGLRLGLSEARVAEVALAATELATNAIVHASSGSLLIRVRRCPDATGVEMVLIDGGPGMNDVEAHFEDGVSTRGTLGVGLGTVRRLANTFEMISRPDTGTVTQAVLCASSGTTPRLPAVDGLSRPITGEEVNGDAWAAAVRDDALRVVVVDGLGHGELAARASRVAIEVFKSDPWSGPAAFVETAHRHLVGTRGAAVLAAQLDGGSRSLRYAGVGNVAGRVIGYDRTIGLVSQPGIVGHRARAVREQAIDIEPDSVLVIHTDGLTHKWDPTTIRQSRTRSPTLLSGMLLRDAGIHHDDATALVVRTSP